MMFHNADCTIFLQKETGYERIPISGVFWDEGNIRNVEATRIFIPLELISFPNVRPEERHYVVRGIVDAGINDSGALREFINTWHPLTITRVMKRDYGSTWMQHWEVEAI